MARDASRWHWRLSDGEGGLRADKAIAEAVEAGRGTWTGEPQPLTRSQVQRLLGAGRVRRNGDALGEANAKLQAGDAVEIEIPPAEPLEILPEDRPLEILYQDEHLLVVNKPAGLTVHPSDTQRENTLVHALLHHVKDLSGIGGKLRPGIVHRIDKDTSGALVVTKTDAAHLALSETFKRHAIEREYWALCYGAPGWEKDFRYETTLGRNPNDRKKMAIGIKDGRKAVSHFRSLESYAQPAKKPFASWIRARLETGRTHQVRVHLASLHASLLGDPAYGAPTANQPKWLALPKSVQEKVKNLPGQALHARTLGFRHPITGEELRFEANPPLAFRELHEELKRYAF